MSDAAAGWPAGVLVDSGDHWTILGALVAVAAGSIVLEQRSKIARTITGAVIALFAGMVLSNARVLPTEAPVYDLVTGYLVPLVIPLLLLRMNIIKVFRETGRMFVVFHFASLGTVVGAFVAVALFHRSIPHLPEIGAAMTASYIGGGVNFVAMVATFQPPKALTSATIVADNAVMALYFLFLIALPAIRLVRRIFPAGPASKAFTGAEGSAADYWKPKPVSLRSLAVSVALAAGIAAVAAKASSVLSAPGLPGIVRDVLGNFYLDLTTLAVAFPLLFPKVAEGLAGAEELGTFLIYVFFVVIGVPASFGTVLHDCPLVFLFCAVILLFNFLGSFGLGRLFGYEIEEMILSAVVSAGGRANGAAISISKGWTGLVAPSVLAGIWGYVIGNYVGVATGNALLAIFPAASAATGGPSP